MAGSLANIVEATADFEAWLGRQLAVARRDLRFKHESMAQALFPFFRATFYRWAQWWPRVCEEAAEAPRVLAVGDLHIENFGSWRDAEGRLIWGVNDLDETWPAAYTVDLVRLAASVYVAIEEDHLCVPRREAVEAIEEGYRDGVARGGEPFVLAEAHRWLRLLALGKLRDPVRFWGRMEQLDAYPEKPPAEALRLIEAALPEGAGEYRLKRRVAGLGSLGQTRVLALAMAQGAWVAREAKATRPSAWVWAKKSANTEILCGKLAATAVRVQDPFFRFHGRWLVRRLAPDCSRIQLASLPEEPDEARLLYSMGFETANMHWGSAAAMRRVKRDLARRKGRWLRRAAKAMCDVTRADWQEWRESWKRGGAKARGK